MSALAVRKVSVAEYLAYEDPSGIKYEYRHGEMFPIADLSYAHGLITANTIGTVCDPSYERGCQVSSQPRTRINAAEYVLPDLAVVCGEPVIASDGALTNPKVVFEVLSPSTSGYDSGDKRRLYCGLPSLAEYVQIGRAHV